MNAHRVAVVGAGTMGHGIAYAAALAGCEVVLTDSWSDALPRALQRIGELLAAGVKRGKISDGERAGVERRLHTAVELEPAVRAADVVIEAIVEDLAVKQRLFAELERTAPPGALLASNTSSLSVGAIAAGVRAPERVVGMHFFNPVPAMKLVEIVTHERAAPLAVDRAVAFARQLGKEPIVVQDSPGFASSRLGVTLGLEAMRMLEQGGPSGPVDPADGGSSRAARGHGPRRRVAGGPGQLSLARHHGVHGRHQRLRGAVRPSQPRALVAVWRSASALHQGPGG